MLDTRQCLDGQSLSIDHGEARASSPDRVVVRRRAQTGIPPGTLTVSGRLSFLRR